jgi:DNA processing protein
MLSAVDMIALGLMKVEGDVLSRMIQGQDDEAINAYLLSLSFESASAKAYQIKEECDRLGIEIIPMGSPQYPSLLMGRKDAPPVLYMKGGKVDNQSLAIIGTRNPTRWGSVVASRTSSLISSKGWNVVSGLAQGVDTEAHKACVELRNPTTAIVACGIDMVPRQDFVDQILSSGGCIISEHPPETRAEKRFFVRRNRLQVAFSKAVFVVQCGLHSGTMHTVRYALQMRVPVFTFKPSGKYANEKASEGNNAIANMEGRELATKVTWDRESRSILLGMNEPVAKSIESKDGIDAILQSLA